MKILSKISSLCMAALILMMSVGVSFANGQDKVVTKARAAVENAAPDDWETLAKSAKKCIQKNLNMKEASQWLDKSLSIKETAYNLEIKGDYYMKAKLPKKAIEFYVESMKKTKSRDFNADTSSIEEKIVEANELQSKIG